MRELTDKERGDVPSSVRLFTMFDAMNCDATFTEEQMLALGEAMKNALVFGASALSGYAYLGQILAHDLSRLRKQGHKLDVQPLASDPLISSVTPKLDLDCIYHLALPGSALRQANSANMKLGEARIDEHSSLPGYDLPRDAMGVAQISDDRNDENLLISQLHLQFLKLHNFFVAKIAIEEPSLDTEALFVAAKEQVVLHYQEVILNDLLYEILHPSVWKSIIHRKKHVLWDPHLNAQREPSEPAVLPIELIGAAGRFGHAMVRSRYRLNKIVGVPLSDLFTMTGDGGLNGEAHLPATHIVDWLYFFDFPSVTRVARPGKNKAGPISPSVNIVLQNTARLPRPEINNLARRNLRRGLQLNLGSGQCVVESINTHFSDALRDNAIAIKPLSDQQLNLNTHTHKQDLLAKHCPEMLASTPLWYYVMAEACVETQEGIGKLGPLGSLILAESITGLLKLDKHSIVYNKNRRSDITPSKEIVGLGEQRFLQMSDLILATNPTLEDPHNLF